MGKAVCRKCDNCGKYSDITVDICECGAKLSGLAEKVVDAERLGDKKGSVNDSCTYYVRKCAYCGEKIYTASKLYPFVTCGKCKTTMIAELVDIDKEDTLDKAQPEEKPAPSAPSKPVQINRPAQSKPVYINRAAQAAPAQAVKNETATPSQPVKNVPSQPPRVRKPTNAIALYEKDGLAPLAVLEPDRAIAPVMIGRNAYLSEYLKKDGRIGRQHCSIRFDNGKWYLADNKSDNGTFLNGRDIGLNGVKVLSDGDKIRLGHDSSSYVIRVEIDN